MLKLQNVHYKTEDGGEILKGVDLEIAEGALTVITGPNGGGKTSLAKIITGIYKPSDGQISLGDKDITNCTVTERARLGIAYAFQQPVKFRGVTVRDLLEISAERKLQADEICTYLSDVGLCAKEYIDRDIDSGLSGGESKRIEIASVLARNNAKLFVFDEPEAGIDLWSFGSLIDEFLKLKADNRTLLVISHQERIMNIADQIIVIADGKVRCSGERDKILAQLFAGEKNGGCPLINKESK